MSLLISDALAEDAAATAASATDPLLSLLPLVLFAVVFYFLLIRPQAKRQKEHKRMVDALAKGDEVVTVGRHRRAHRRPGRELHPGRDRRRRPGQGPPRRRGGGAAQGLPQGPLSRSRGRRWAPAHGRPRRPPCRAAGAGRSDPARRAPPPPRQRLEAAMNQYPLWKNLLILGVVLVGLVLALPNVFSQDPSIEITAARGSEMTDGQRGRGPRRPGERQGPLQADRYPAMGASSWCASPPPAISCAARRRSKTPCRSATAAR